MTEVDVIFYINLENRADRNEHFLKEISSLVSDPAKIVRIDAIKNNMGALGCSYSHIKAIEEFEKNPNWTTCIIFEDDFTFRNKDPIVNNDSLKNFFNNFPEWDIMCLAHNPKVFVYDNTHDEKIVRVKETVTTSGYCLHKRFAATLKQNFIESSSYMNQLGICIHLLCLDEYWKKLQPISNWYAMKPAMGYQYSSFSDVSQVMTEYNC
jgi:GR25 family glycosyltransferase involved in LPS biosynthesis